MQKNFKELGLVSFPKYQGIMVNMMPIIVGDVNTLPDNLKGYQKIIAKSDLKIGSVGYLTVRESIIQKGQSQGRGGIHVEAPKLNAWGGGGWGSIEEDKGIYMASNDGACNIWDEMVEERDEFGACVPKGNPKKMNAGSLYWMTDKTPHEALVSEVGFKRQFFRLVSEDVSLWFSQHNTPNPKGIIPSCKIVDYNKFH